TVLINHSLLPKEMPEQNWTGRTGKDGARSWLRMLPLDDVKVVDFMWALAGPGTTRTLADYGATVIRIESASRVDGARTVGPFVGNKSSNDGSGLFGTYNAGKLGLALDLNKPEAREVVLDLVRWADVVCESFSPRAMRAWRLDYESLRQIKPAL